MVTNFSNIAALKRQPGGLPQPMQRGMRVTMPSVSQKQQIAMAIAEHYPDKLYARNKGLTKMTHSQLHDFAATPRKDLPKSAPKRRHKVEYPQPTR